MLSLVRRWYPEREIVAVADRAYASLKLLSRCRSLSKPVTFITRLRLDAALYEPAPPRRPGQRGRPRLKGERLPNLSVVGEAPDTVWKPNTIANWYGSGERAVEIVSETAVWYSTGLFSLATLIARRRMTQGAGAFRRTAWYDKEHPTFADALASVRKELWAQEQATFRGSPADTDTVKVSRVFVERLTDALCYAA